MDIENLAENIRDTFTPVHKSPITKLCKAMWDSVTSEVDDRIYIGGPSRDAYQQIDREAIRALHRTMNGGHYG